MNWNLTDIFKDKKEYKKMKEDLLKNLDKIEQYKGKLCNSAQNLYECYKIDELALKQFEKVYAYVNISFRYVKPRKYKIIQRCRKSRNYI